MATQSRHLLIHCVSLALVVLLSGTVGAATYSNGVFSDPVNGFRINVPADWRQQNMNNNDSSTHLSVSPDQNVAVGVTTYPDGGGTPLGQLLGHFQQAAFAGSALVAQQDTSINNMTGTLQAFKIENPNGPIIVGAFATHGQGKAYVLWSMIPQSMYQSRVNDSDALLNTFAMISPTPAPTQPKPPQTAPTSQPEKQQAPLPPDTRQTVQSPVTPPAEKTPDAQTSSSPLPVPAPETTSYRTVKNVPEFTFDVPSSYTGSVKGNQLILGSTDPARSELAIVLQKMARTPGGAHETLEKSVESALSQLRGAPSAQLLEQKPIEIDGVPAVWIELTYDGADGPRRMAQVITADAAAVYWLGFNGPQASFNRQVEDLNHAVKTARLSARPGPASSPGASGSPEADAYQSIVFDDSLFEFSFPKTFAVFQKKEGVSQWGDPGKAYGKKVVMVIQSLGRDAGNTAKSVNDGLVAQVNASASATLLSADQAVVNGIPAYKLHFTLTQSGGKSIFRYLVLDLPGPHVVTVSFVAPEFLSPEADAHYAELLRSVKSTAGSAKAPDTQRPPVPSGSAQFTEPSSPEDAFHAVQSTVKAGNWEGFVRLLHTKTVEIEMSRFFGVLAEENHVDIAGLSPREAMLKVFQQVPRAAESKLFLGKPASITGTRKEDGNRVLVMARFDGGGEHKLWMFRENGNWRWMYQ